MRPLLQPRNTFHPQPQYMHQPLPHNGEEDASTRVVEDAAVVVAAEEVEEAADAAPTQRMQHSPHRI